MPAPIAQAYADCIDLPCPRCRAESNAYCLNPISQKFSAVPCVARIHESENNR